MLRITRRLQLCSYRDQIICKRSCESQADNTTINDHALAMQELQKKLHNFVQEQDVTNAIQVFRELLKNSRKHHINTDFLHLVSIKRGIEFAVEVFVSCQFTTDTFHHTIAKLIEKHNAIKLVENLVESQYEINENTHWILFSYYLKRNQISKVENYWQSNPEIHSLTQFSVPYCRFCLQNGKIEQVVPILKQLQQLSESSRLYSQFSIEMDAITNNTGDLHNVVESLLLNESEISPFTLSFVLSQLYYKDKDSLKQALQLISDGKIPFGINVSQNFISNLANTKDFDFCEKFVQWQEMTLDLPVDVHLLRLLATSYLKNNEIDRYNRLKQKYFESFKDFWLNDHLLVNQIDLYKISKLFPNSSRDNIDKE